MQIFGFFVLYIFTLATNFTRGATIPNPPGAKCNAICTTPACTKEAEFLKDYIDSSVDPCDDFYQFVCGNYVKNVLIPGDRILVNHFETVRDKIQIDLINELKAEVKPSDLKSIKNVKTHYQNCLDEGSIENVGEAPLLISLEKLGGWPVYDRDAWIEEDYNWQDTISKISKLGFLPEFPVKLSVHNDFTNSSNYILGIMPAATTIDESFFVNGSKSLEAYETLMIEIAVLLGVRRENATAEMKECLKFEIELFKLKTKTPDTPIPQGYKQTVKTLSNNHRGIPWLDIFNMILNPSNINIDENEMLGILDTPFMSKIQSLISNTPKRVLANYQIWRVILNLIDYLPRSYTDLKFNFYKGAYGYQSLPPRDEVCFNWVHPAFETVISAMYAKKYFDKKSKNRADRMIQYIREEFESELHKVQWMDDITRRNALEKLQAMKSSVGYPDELENDTKLESIYQDLEISPGTFAEGYRRVSNITKNLNLNKLRKTVDETHWMLEAENIAYVNAKYEQEENKIQIVAGILQEPFFKYDRPEYLNYGAIGYIVGHEIIHGFDSTGRQFDKFGNVKNWWDENTANEFDNRVKCIVDQFNDYTIKQIDRKVNGNITRDENIADGGGYKLAYHAYKNFINSTGKTEECLPNLNYSPQQMFWISAASTWCSKSTDEYMHTLLIDEHSPFEARINVGLSNVQEFSDDFNCPLGSKMNPINKCTIW